MSIVGIALRGFGKALGRGTKNTGKKKFDARREAFGNAAFKNDVSQTMKKGSRILGEFSKSLKKATKTSKKLTDKIKKD